MWTVVLLAVAVAVQVSLLPTLRPLGVVPNLALVVMVLVAVSVPTSEALVGAAVCGLILDLASGINFGLWTGIMMLVTLVAGVLHRSGVELDRSWVPLVLVACGTASIALVIWLGLARTVTSWPVLILTGRLGLELMINLGLTVALMPFVQWLLRGSRRQSEVGGFE